LPLLGFLASRVCAPSRDEEAAGDPNATRCAKRRVGGCLRGRKIIDDRFWKLIDHPSLLDFDEAARRALASE